MRVEVRTLDGAKLSISEFNADTLMDLTEAFNADNVRLLAFALDDGMAYIPKAAVARIDVLDE